MCSVRRRTRLKLDKNKYTHVYIYMYKNKSLQRDRFNAVQTRGPHLNEPRTRAMLSYTTIIINTLVARARAFAQENHEVPASASFRQIFRRRYSETHSDTASRRRCRYVLVVSFVRLVCTSSHKIQRPISAARHYIDRICRRANTTHTHTNTRSIHIYLVQIARAECTSTSFMPVSNGGDNDDDQSLCLFVCVCALWDAH